MHRQHVDYVGPVVAMSVAVAKQLRGDRVTVVLVADQDAAEGVAGLRVERLEEGMEVSVHWRKLSSPKLDVEFGDGEEVNQRGPI